jgi:DNA-binding XRE family transcriptional regulator
MAWIDYHIEWERRCKQMTLAERMIQYRAKERINQQVLADRCGLSKQTIYSVENEMQEPSKVTQAKIELVIGKEQEA